MANLVKKEWEFSSKNVTYTDYDNDLSNTILELHPPSTFLNSMIPNITIKLCITDNNSYRECETLNITI